MSKVGSVYETPKALEIDLSLFLVREIYRPYYEKDINGLEVPLTCKDDEAYENRYRSRRIKRLGWGKLTRPARSFSFYFCERMRLNE